jgi:hypothetical protein
MVNHRGKQWKFLVCTSSFKADDLFSGILLQCLLDEGKRGELLQRITVSLT